MMSFGDDVWGMAKQKIPSLIRVQSVKATARSCFVHKFDGEGMQFCC